MTTRDDWERKVREQNEDLRAWERSLEGVHYQLSLEGVDIERLDVCITKTVAKLPDDVRHFVYDSCSFLSVQLGLTWPPDDRWKIILDDSMADDLDPSDVESVIAHEIAHAYLGHSVFTLPELNPSGKYATSPVEVEARELAEQWGFEGIGTEPPEDE